MPELSIIIPIYNAECYLHACLDSIISQTFQQFEVLMIDDGSMDKSAIICKDYSYKDARFRYFHQKNMGVSSARNKGIENSLGKWIIFIDADDTLPISALATLYGLANEDVDLVIGGYIVRRECGAVSQKTQTIIHDLCRTEAMNILFLEHKYGYQGYVWNKLFKNSIIKNHRLKFHESFHFNEDRLFCVQYICTIMGKIILTSQPVYEYIQHSNSVMGQVHQQFNQHIYDDYESSLLILHQLKVYNFPQSSINLARDRIIDSYDMIRHHMKRTKYKNAVQEKRKLRQRAIFDAGGWMFFVGNRVRRFLSRQISHILRTPIYIQAYYFNMPFSHMHSYSLM